MHCCRIVNGIKNKNIKNSLGAMWNATHLAVRLCALRHWKRVSMPPTTQSLRHPLTRAHHIAPRIKTARRSRRKTPDGNMVSWKEVVSNLPKRFCMVGTRYFESTEKVGRGAILPFFLLITYGHSQLSIIGGVRFFVAGGVRAFGGEALVQVADFVVVLLKKKGGLFV